MIDEELIRRARMHLTLMDDEQQASGQIDHMSQLAWVNTFGRPFLELLERLNTLLEARALKREVDETLKAAYVGKTDGVVDQLWDAEGRPLDPGHPAGTYTVQYPEGYAHSQKRLKALLDAAGDTMASVATLMSFRDDTPPEQAQAIRDWRRRVYAEHEGLKTIPLANGPVTIQEPGHYAVELLADGTARLVPANRDVKPANVLPPMAGYCSKGHVVRGTIDKCGQIRCEPCGALVTPYPYCRAGRDGDCNWEACPQIVGPYQQHCPLDGPNPAEDIDEHECGCHPFIENCTPESETEDCICSCHNMEVHNFRRASGAQPCPVCERPYREHPLGGRRGMDDKRFLRRLCNGQLIKT